MPFKTKGKIAIIGGTSSSTLIDGSVYNTLRMETPYGDPSSELLLTKIGDKEVVFLARHGSRHTIPPHKVNYRANIYALKQYGVDTIIAVNAVGGITEQMYPGRIIIPEQIVDYTYGRQQTFYDDDLSQIMHVDFTHPYSSHLRQKLAALGAVEALDIFVGGVYAATQGPRLETAAEIQKLAADGCNVVGMTGMPEAALARELDLHYICLAVVSNWAAGKIDAEFTMAMIKEQLQKSMHKIQSLLNEFIAVI